jgi:glycosyltransferase involved in cell wall biosynthesis
VSRIAVAGGFGDVVAKVRGSLLRTLRREGHRVLVSVPVPTPAVRAEVESALAALDVEVDWAPLDRSGLNPLRERGLRRHYASLFRRWRPDAVLAYNPKPIFHAIPAARAAGVSRSAALVTGLGFAFIDRSWKGRLLSAVACRWYRRSARLADAFLFQNPDDRDEFVRRKLIVPGLRVVTLPGGGVDLDAFPARELPAGTGPPVFLFVGRLLGDKGVRELAAAARMVRSAGVPARIRLVGPFDENPSGLSRREVGSWVAEGLLEVPGRVADVRPELTACHAFVLPSYREGSPNASLEALATGRAIVTTDVPGCRETVVDGGNGRLVPARDPRALADAIVSLARDPALVRRMGAASRRLAERRFDARAVDRTIIDVLLGHDR